MAFTCETCGHLIEKNGEGFVLRGCRHYPSGEPFPKMRIPIENGWVTVDKDCDENTLEALEALFLKVVSSPELVNLLNGK